MDPATTRKAVEMVGGKFQLEASGGITLETIARLQDRRRLRLIRLGHPFRAQPRRGRWISRSDGLQLLRRFDELLGGFGRRRGIAPFRGIGHRRPRRAPIEGVDAELLQFVISRTQPGRTQ